MAQEEYSAGDVKITVGEKSVGQQALDNIPVYGSAKKTFDALTKATEGGTTGPEAQAVVSESQALISACTGAAAILTDPIGWLVEQGLGFLINVVQPLQDAIHAVSGDGPALSQAAGNFEKIGKGVIDLRKKFDEELRQSLRNWGGDASEAAGTKLADFAKGMDGVGAQAGDVSTMLHSSSKFMIAIEEFIKALLSEFITWLIMIWIPALASAAFTFGGSTAAATTATTAKAASTASRTTRMLNKLRRLLEMIRDFIRKVAGNLRHLKTGFKKAMEHKQTLATRADIALEGRQYSRIRDPIQAVRSSDGAVGGRVNAGFGRSMAGTAGQTAHGAVKPFTEPTSADEIGTDYTKEQTEEHFDI